MKPTNKEIVNTLAKEISEAFNLKKQNLKEVSLNTKEQTITVTITLDYWVISENGAVAVKNF